MDNDLELRPPHLYRLCPGKRRVPNNSDPYLDPASSTLDTPTVCTRDGFPRPQACVLSGSLVGGRWRNGRRVTPNPPTPIRGELRYLGRGPTEVRARFPYLATHSLLGVDSPLQSREIHGIGDVWVAHDFQF